MEKRVTIYSIAEKLDISSMTVYRALSNKCRISAVIIITGFPGFLNYILRNFK